MQIVSQMFADPSAAHDRAMKWQRKGYKNIRITPTTDKVTEQRVFLPYRIQTKGNYLTLHVG